MSDGAETPRQFYTERIPDQFNRALRDQERLVERATRQLEGMRAVTASIRVDVRGEGGGTFFLNVEKGRMSAGEAPTQTPFLTLVQERTAFERLVREAGDSALGWLGGVSGLAGEMRLTRARLEQLAELEGCVRFEVSGDDGFWLLTHFGQGAPPEEPSTTIRVAPQTYAELRAGRLDPQNAFMSGQIQVEGDLQLAMHLALAALSPD
jgi:hypothetical protein